MSTPEHERQMFVDVYGEQEVATAEQREADVAFARSLLSPREPENERITGLFRSLFHPDDVTPDDAA